MEDVIQVLVVIVIITSVLISKYKEARASRPQKHVQAQVSQPEDEDNLSDDADEEEVIPMDIEDDIDQEDSEPFNIFGQFGKVHQPDEPKPIFKQVLNENPPIEPTTFTPETICTDEIRGVKHTKQPKVRIKSKREARLAFIHSEIFNRKYE